ncbi:DUF1643 domain-containing protein [Frankia sp. AgB1.9]|uniref:hypothetical protein n=1 Tax=unclassified Frankia TaxID=2632575 RepID=UPI0019328B0D|nr:MULTISPECIES: hypothetical protein [unclassified Frankia]MBL7487500.1 DUF1643 domain-containing protein [Frankia sp. AgW1.1]MBL7547462.1 DUF1643 domain-containing protein [Frankia sp. AgB1.9]MBL7618762.1 hypothetical protein [Frankia sp. AgB1.8]
MSDNDLPCLLAVLTNPPLTPGTRTVRRVELAADLLGFTEVRVANLFSLPSAAAGEIDVLGATVEGWLMARDLLNTAINGADGVLLAYGATAPSGAARLHHGDQVAWLKQTIAATALPVWRVGDGPRHPSRWQRWTYRTHPGVPFRDALQRSLVQLHPVAP